MSPFSQLLCSCFSSHNPASTDDEQLIHSAPTQCSSSPSYNTMPRHHPSVKEMSEAYTPSWANQKLSPDPQQRPTGLRARGASASIAQAPASSSLSSSSSSSSSQPAVAAPATGNSMLYFGAGVTPQRAMRTYIAGPPPPSKGGGSTSSAAGRSGGGSGNASGRDASGYAPSGVSGAPSGLAGMYSSLTYGGSTQYNFAGTQSYGAGTGGGGGGGGGGFGAGLL